MDRYPVHGKMYPGFRWFVLKTVPRKERLVITIIDVLQQGGMIPYSFLLQELWYPSYVDGSTIRAYIPGYVFVKTILTEKFYDQFHANRFPYVYGWVRVGKHIAQVPEEQMQYLRELSPSVEQEVEVSIAIGDTVSLNMAGMGKLVGEVESILPGGKVLMSTIFFRREMIFEVSLSDVWRVDDA